MNATSPKARHTAGEWVASQQINASDPKLREGWTISAAIGADQGTRYIADLCGWGNPRYDEENAANARLIAAAPLMLQALLELVAEADDHPGWEGHPHSDTVGFEWAREAIAKTIA